jgi:hypothetical protein
LPPSSPSVAPFAILIVGHAYVATSTWSQIGWLSVKDLVIVGDLHLLGGEEWKHGAGVRHDWRRLWVCPPGRLLFLEVSMDGF